MNGYTNGYTSDTGAYGIGRGEGNRIEERKKEMEREGLIRELRMDASTQECPINDGRRVEGLMGPEGYYFIEIHQIKHFFSVEIFIESWDRDLAVILVQFLNPLKIGHNKFLILWLRCDSRFFFIFKFSK